jgi:two-component system, cell cycle response regulator
VEVYLLSKDDYRHLELDRLNKAIEELRDTLNEICCTVDENENDKERLIISQYLDNLIVEYMRELNKE